MPSGVSGPVESMRTKIPEQLGRFLLLTLRCLLGGEESEDGGELQLCGGAWGEDLRPAKKNQ